MAYCACGGRHSYLHRQCICLERSHKARHGGNGIISFGNYVGIFYCHFISWAFRRISWRYCGASWPAQVGTGFCLFLRLRHGGDGICRLCKVGGAFVPVLRMYRGDRTGNRVYHSGIHAGEVVSSASRLCYGSGHYGIWICRSYCGPCHAVPYCDGRAGGEFPYSCRGLCGGDGAFCILPSGAPSGRGGSLS